MNHGGKLEWEKEMQWGKSEVKMTFLCVFYHLYTNSVNTNTHHISQSDIQKESCSNGSYPLFGSEVRGYRQSDIQADERGHGTADV